MAFFNLPKERAVKQVLILLSVVLVTACGKSPEPANTSSVAAEGANAGTSTEPVIPPTVNFPGNSQAASGAFPEDGPQFFEDMKAIDLAIRNSDKGQFVALPLKRTTEGYPVFPLSCEEAKFGTVCSDAQQNAFEENDLLNRLPLVRNSLIFDQQYRCDVLCLDQDGHLIGKLSDQAREWKLQNMLGVVSTAVVPAENVSGAEEQLFSCKTKRGKQIDLIASGGNVTYSFGKIGSSPEITLTVPKAKATTQQWDGTTSSMSYSVNVPSGNTVYSVFWSAVRDPDATNPISAGVNVEIAGKHAATVECDPDSVVQALEDVDLPAA